MGGITAVNQENKRNDKNRVTSVIGSYPIFVFVKPNGQ